MASKENPNPVANWFAGAMLLIAVFVGIFFAKTHYPTDHSALVAELTDCNVLKYSIGVKCGTQAYFATEITGIRIGTLAPGEHVRCDLSGATSSKSHFCELAKHPGPGQHPGRTFI